MTPSLRTVSILMLLAGIALGVFTARALRAMGPGDLLTGPARDPNPKIEMLVDLYRREYHLDDTRTDQVRQELQRFDQKVGALIWELRQQNADKFRGLFDEASRRIGEVLEPK